MASPNSTASSVTMLVFDADVLLRDWNTRLANLFIPLDVLFILITCVGFLGNMVVCIVYKFCMKGKINDRFFIPLLALMDAMVCLVGPIISLILSIRPVTFYGDAICKISIFCFRVMLNSSVLLMLVIAVQRYRKVCHPFGGKYDLKRCKIDASISISFATIMAIPNLIFFGEIPVRDTIKNITVVGHRCGLRTEGSELLDTTIYFYQVLCFIVVVAIVIALIVMYSCVGKKIYVQAKRVEHARTSSMTSGSESDSQYGSSTGNSGNGGVKLKLPEKGRSKASNSESSTMLKSNGSRRSQRSRSCPSTPTSPNGSMSKPHFKQKRAKSVSRRYTILFMAISVFFVLSYLPTLLANTISKNMWDSPSFWTDNSDQEKTMYTYLFFTYFINHIANPFFYGFFDSSFRRRIAKSCRCNFLAYRFGK
ncbi:orexin receptor type 2-like [Pecten maximus]|uniref:orexin receptor type 2-like n=1 Tax=Pecten maximus TaxID=6579 RepID=UPI001457E5D4|nr:orexin receptor type 2-like [Pecten maximus]